MPHELVAFDGATGAADLWVTVPVLSATGPTVLYLYHGGSPASAPMTWPSMFAGVWHMTGSNGAFPDSAAGHGAAQSVAARRPADVAGIAGRATTYDGVDDSTSAGDPSDGSLDFGLESFAYSTWVNVSSSAGPYDHPFYKGGSSSSFPGYDLELGTGMWEALLDDGSTGITVTFGSEAQLLGRWVYLAVVVDRAAGVVRGYRDGIETDTSSLAGVGSLSNTSAVEIGRSSAHFRGAVDEVRVYRTAIPPAWIVAEYANQTRRDLITIGPDEVP